MNVVARRGLPPRIHAPAPAGCRGGEGRGGSRKDPELPMRIADYLDRPLWSAIRVRTLESLAGEVTAQPVSAVVCDLRQVLQDRRLHGDDKLRLNILLSQLYHRGGITGPHMEQLRTEIATAWEARTHAHRKGGPSAEPRSAPGPGPR